MSVAEAEALLIATTNSFGRQHHLARKRSQPIPFSPLDSNVGGKHGFSAAAVGDELPQLATDREAVITRSGGSAGFWFDAEACSRCDQHAASPPCSSRSGRSGDQWHDAMSEGQCSPARHCIVSLKAHEAILCAREFACERRVHES